METNIELWLVRHGETVFNASGLLAGWSDTELTAKGEAQARALRPLLESELFAQVWSSDLSRAMTTARLAYGEPTADARLREIHFGDLEGQPWSEIEAPFRDGLLVFDQFSAPGGEDLERFGQRLQDFVSSLRPGRHLVFSHGGAIRMLTRELGLDSFLPNAGLAAVDWSKRKLLFVRGAPGP